MSLDADIPLSQVLQFASHLVHWGKAMTINITESAASSLQG